jgi:acetyltransferase-like isoleucine patch superfamily enzyme
MNHHSSQDRPGSPGGGAEVGPPQPARPKSMAEGSALQKYQDFVVGTRSLGALVYYELVMGWGALLPGALGLGFRQVLWPRLFSRCGGGVVWGRSNVVRHPGKMWIGDGVMVDDECFFDAKGCAEGEFRLDDGVIVSRACMITGKGGGVHLGPRVNVGTGCMILSDAGITIGADTMLAGNCYVGGGAYDADAPIDVPMSERPLVARPIDIGEDCWLGAGVVVIEGVTIGRGSVIGAGSVVTRDVPPYSIAVGAPARVLRKRRHAPARS